MSHAKETPRQKMIGLMYLVLTCLLALNVSREVLTGFVTINESIETTNSNFTGNTKKIMEAIDEAIAQGRHEFVPYYAKSKEVTQLTQKTFDYVDSLKKELIKYTEDTKGADTLKLGQVEKLDDYDKPTFMLLGADETKPKTGKYSAKELKQTILTLTDSLNNMLDNMKDRAGLKLPPKDYEILKEKIKLFTPHDNYKDKEGLPLTWEMKNFYNLPLAAVVTNLSKIQGDLRNIEGEMINTFASAPGKLSVKFDRFYARVVPVSKYVQTGTPFTADVLLSASSSDFKEDNIQFILGDVDTTTGKLAPDAIVLPVDSGTGKINLPTNLTGNKEIKGWIKFREGTGLYRYFKYESDYTVANAAVAVSADKMNVFYAAIENPLTVSAAGVASHDLVVNIEGCGGTLANSGNGKYIAKVNGTGVCTVSVFKRTAKGLEKQGTPQVFRVKKIPSPMVRINSRTIISSDDFNQGDARNIRSVNIDNTNFELNAPFEVKSFMISFAGPGTPYQEFKCTGNKLTDEAAREISRIRKSAKIYVEDIVINGPDGQRKLGTVKINVK
ncbi:MAG: gliding motility protein GldM [Bacteroidia bacterium]|nr:gliding motility protein GldM [Bacteroidia bacterium]